MENKFSINFLICFVVILTVLFYWFQIRPAQIKHDCSWVKHHSDAMPEKIGETEAQLKAEGKLKVCPTLIPVKGGLSVAFYEMFNSNRENTLCTSDNKDVISKNRPQRYTSAKDWYEKATDEEYKFCLRDQGL